MTVHDDVDAGDNPPSSLYPSPPKAPNTGFGLCSRTEHILKILGVAALCVLLFLGFVYLVYAEFYIYTS